MGAYTELFAGLDPSVTSERSGGYIHPWGRFCSPRDDLQDACKLLVEGGTGKSLQFWEWTEHQIREYV